MGAPHGNKNALRSGLSTKPRRSRSPLVLGAVPKDCEHINRNVYRFGWALVDATIAARAKPSIPDPMLTVQDWSDINTACRSEQRVRLLYRRYALLGEAITVDQELTILSGVAKATEARDRAIAKLNLNRDHQADVWSKLKAAAIDVRATGG